MKSIKLIFLCLSLCLFSSVFSSTATVQNALLNKEPGSSLVNKYKDLKNPFGHHSLFTGHNSENVSNSVGAVPPPIPEK